MENLIITKASEVTVKEVEWLWYPYIPYGKVTVLQGDSGDGIDSTAISPSLAAKCISAARPPRLQWIALSTARASAWAAPRG